MFIVEGNIGVGKSTFLKLMAMHEPTITPIYEPVQQWQSQIAGTSILSEFYSNPHRWAFTMETMAMASRVHDHIQVQNAACYTYALIERSIYSGHYCFALNDYKAGFLTELEWQIYSTWFSMLITQCKIPRGFIYLKVTPEIAYARMVKRSRASESSVPIAYLEEINKRHEEFLIDKNLLPDTLRKVPVLVIDCDKDFEEDTAYFQEIAQKVTQFMQNN